MLAIVPSEEDLLCALRRLCSGKASGGSQIVPELLKAGGSVLLSVQKVGDDEIDFLVAAVLHEVNDCVPWRAQGTQ